MSFVLRSIKINVSRTQALKKNKKKSNKFTELAFNDRNVFLWKSATRFKD